MAAQTLAALAEQLRRGKSAGSSAEQIGSARKSCRPRSRSCRARQRRSWPRSSRSIALHDCRRRPRKRRRLRSTRSKRAPRSQRQQRPRRGRSRADRRCSAQDGARLRGEPRRRRSAGLEDTQSSVATVQAARRRRPQDRKDRRRDRADHGADQHAGGQRLGRSRARRRVGPRLCGRLERHPRACARGVRQCRAREGHGARNPRSDRRA